MKRKFHLVLDDATHRRLKAKAAINGLNIGDTIQALLNFTEAHQYTQDDVFQQRFSDLLESEMGSVNKGGWTGDK